MATVKLFRLSFCLSLIALNGQHFILDHIITASPPAETPIRLSLLFIGFLYKSSIIALATATIFDYRAKASVFMLGCLVLCWVLFRHLPFVIADITDPAELNSVCMALAIAGSAFIIADSFKEPFLVYQNKLNAVTTTFAKPLGKTLLGLPMIVFGSQHLMYAAFIATLIPVWIPGSYFWAITTGLALIASGVSIVFEWTHKISSLLLAMMIWSWVMIVHVPRITMNPADTYEWTNLLQAVLIATGASALQKNLSVNVTRHNEPVRQIEIVKVTAKTRSPLQAKGQLKQSKL